MQVQSEEGSTSLPLLAPSVRLRGRRTRYLPPCMREWRRRASSTKLGARPLCGLTGGGDVRGADNIAAAAVEWSQGAERVFIGVVPRKGQCHVFKVLPTFLLPSS